MLKWLLVSFFVVLLLARTPLAKFLKIGKLPGDVDIQIKKFKLFLPFTSVALLFIVLWGLKKVI